MENHNRFIIKNGMKKFWNEKYVAPEFFHSILAELLYG